MRRLLSLAALLIVLGAPASAAGPASPPMADQAGEESAALNATFAASLQRLWDADARFEDTQFAERTTAGYVRIDEIGTVSTRADVLREPMTPELRARVASMWAPAHISARVSDVHAVRYGETALVRARVDWHSELNGQNVAKRFQMGYVFVRSGDRWLMAQKQETIVPLAPVPRPVDRALYDGYVGDYQLLPGYVYHVTRNGDRLFFGAGTIREIVPENDTTFVISGNVYRVVFQRDPDGRTNAVRVVEFPGVEYTASRIK